LKRETALIADKKPEKLTPLETLVMECMWEMEQATVRKVQQKLNEDHKDRAYNTVLTVLRMLRDKGYLQSRREGRSDVYWPVVSRSQAARRPLRELIERFFAGSAEALVSQLLSTGDLDAEEVRAIREEADQKLREEAMRGGSDQ